MNSVTILGSVVGQGFLVIAHLANVLLGRVPQLKRHVVSVGTKPSLEDFLFPYTLASVTLTYLMVLLRSKRISAKRILRMECVAFNFML